MTTTTKTTAPGMVLAVVALGNFLVSLALSPVSAILPTMARSLNTEVTDISWAVSSYLIALTSILLIAGRMGDVFSHRRVFAVGLVLYLIAAVASAMSPNVLTLVASRALHGIGAGLISGNGLAIVASTVDQKSRGRAVGIVTMASSAGALIGSVGAIGVTGLLGWRWVFLAIIPVAVVGLAGALRLPDSSGVRAKARDLDYAGPVLLLTTLLALSLSLTHAHSGSETFQDGLAWHLPLQVFTVISLIAFLFVESRHPNPLVPLRLLRNGPFAMTMSANLVLHMTMMATFYLMPVLIERGLELPPSATALLIAGILTFTVTLAPLSGWLYDRTGWRLLTPAAMAFVAAGFLLIGLVATSGSLAQIIGVASLVGVGSGMFLTSNNTIAMSQLAPGDRGFASGMVGTTQQLGHAVAVTFAALIMAGALGSDANPSPSAYLHGFQRTATIMGFVAVGGIALAYLSAAAAGRAGRRVERDGRAGAVRADAEAEVQTGSRA